MKRIKEIDELFDEYNEALKNPVPIKWIDNGDILRGLFNINGNVYQIVAKNFGSDIWSYNFYHFKDYENFTPELTNIGSDKWRVLPMVSDGLKYLVDNKSVNAIIFGAADGSKGRKKIYESFCKDFSKINGLEFYTNISEDHKQLFIMYKVDCDLGELRTVLFKIIESEK
jgi:hypothetical protein